LQIDDFDRLLGRAIQSGRDAEEASAGVATGLAWSEAGGDVLYIEATLLPDGKA